MYGASIGRSAGPHLRSVSFCHHLRSHPPHGEQGVNGQRLMVPLSLSLTLPRSAPPRLSFSLVVPLSFSLCFSPPLPHFISLSFSLSRGVTRVTTHYRVPFSARTPLFFPSLCPPLTLASSSTVRPLPRRNCSAPNGVTRRSERSGVCTRIGPRSMTD